MPRRGFTMGELALTLTLLGLLAGSAMPRVVALTDGAALRAASSDVLRGLDAARGLGTRLGRTVALESDGPTLVVRGIGPDTAVWWRGPHPTRHGVTATGLERRILFGAEGLATGVSNRTIRLERRGRRRALVLSRLGRVR